MYEPLYKHRRCIECHTFFNLEEIQENNRSRKPTRCAECEQLRVEAKRREINYKRVKSLYNLSPEEYDSLIQECTICGSREKLHIDHDHKTGEVRGVLCHRHNVAIGHFQDNPVHLERASKYLLGKLITRTANSIKERIRTPK